MVSGRCVGQGSERYVVFATATLDAGAHVAARHVASSHISPDIIPAALVIFIGRGTCRATTAGARWPAPATGGVAGATLAARTTTLARTSPQQLHPIADHPQLGIFSCRPSPRCRV